MLSLLKKISKDKRKSWGWRNLVVQVICVLFFFVISTPTVFAVTRTGSVLVMATVMQQCSLDLGSLDTLELGGLIINGVSFTRHRVSIDWNTLNGFQLRLRDTTGLTSGTATFPDIKPAPLNGAPSAGDVANIYTTSYVGNPYNSFGMFGVSCSENYQEVNTSCASAFGSKGSYNQDLYSGLDSINYNVIAHSTGPTDAIDGQEYLTVSYGIKAGSNAPPDVYQDTVVYSLIPEF